MLKFFKRTRPTHRATPAPTQPSPEDRAIASWYGFTPAEWSALDNHVRTTKRSSYFQARGL